MSDRKTASTINDADLDQLYADLDALRAVARGYCPTCGRGDAAPTVADWEQQKQRADEAEEFARRALAQRQEMAEERYAWQERGDRAEAAITRVRAIAGWAINGWSDLSPQKVLAALDQPTAPAATEATSTESCPRTTPDNPTTSSNTADNPPGGRREQLPGHLLALISPTPYLSTACHTAFLCETTQPTKELAGWPTRLHARCRLNHKFTGRPCICPCHKEA